MTTALRSLAVAVVIALLLPAIAAAQRTEELNGYAEWRVTDGFIVDGQRVRVDAQTVFKGKARPTQAAVVLGDEMKVKGVREPDGAVQAREIEAKPNGTAAFEGTVFKATDEA